MAILSEPDLANADNTLSEAANRQAVAIMTAARRSCLDLGLTSEQLGALLLDEAMLAWLMSEWSERDVRKKLMEAMGRDVKMWYARARVATGQCDCVQEVHLEGLMEMERLENGDANNAFPLMAKSTLNRSLSRQG